MLMRNIIVSIWFVILAESSLPQIVNEFTNTEFLKKLNNNRSYIELRNKITAEYSQIPAGRWGEFVPGVSEAIQTKNKIIAFTFDACGGKNGNGYDSALIEYMRQEKIPATLFVSGKWIDSQFKIFRNLSHDTIFEIENHGLNHRPCSISGESAYGIHGTSDIKAAFDEIEANERKIEAITGYRPRFYRSATAFIDETCVRMAAELGITTISYQVLSGDAIPFTAESVIQKNVLNNVKPGAIVLMHFNHPEWNTMEAMQKIVPLLRTLGYSFVLLKDYKLESVRIH
jgi:peptidoglycan/xylan/chitin deacetylase (PgdA/CDA1 family)